MSLSGKWIAAVAQTSALRALNQAFRYEAQRWEWAGVWENEAFANFTRAMMMTTTNNNTLMTDGIGNSTAAAAGLNSTTTTDLSTIGNVTNTNNAYNQPLTGGLSLVDRSTFYLGRLPRAVFFVYAVTSALHICWLVWLERLFPGRRPRRTVVEVAAPHEKRHGGGEIVEGDEDREEEVVKRWIAEGKVRRASLSWSNTLCKWILDVTVGATWIHAVQDTIEALMERKSFSDIGGIWTVGNLLTDMVVNLISPWPLVVLISFAVIPAERRLPFRAAVHLFYAIFQEASLRATIPWLLNTDLAQGILRSATARKLQETQNLPSGGGVHVIDEL